jgi:hypothetical protein
MKNYNWMPILRLMILRSRSSVATAAHLRSLHMRGLSEEHLSKVISIRQPYSDTPSRRRTSPIALRMMEEAVRPSERRSVWLGPHDGRLKVRLAYRLYPLSKCTTATAIRLVTGNPSASSESTTKKTP